MKSKAKSKAKGPTRSATKATGPTADLAQQPHGLAAPQMAPTGPSGTGTALDTRPQPKASYNGTQPGRLSTPWKNWSYGNVDPRNRYQTSFERLQALSRARDLQQNNALACGMFEKAADGVVGDTGFRLQVLTADDDYNNRAEALINGWLPTADSSGISFNESCRFLVQSKKRDGDVFVLLLQDGTYQVVEGDLVSSLFAGTKDGWIDGVRFNNNRAAQYQVTVVDTNGKQKPISIDAIDCIQYAKRYRHGQPRGMSEFTSIFNLFDQLDGWIEALVVAARVAASYSIIVTKNGAQFTLAQAETERMQDALFGADDSNCPTEDTVMTADGPVPCPRRPQTEIKVAPGMVNFLNNGEKIEQLNPTQPNQNFPDSLRMLLRILGSAIGFPLEIIIGDYSTVSGAAARVALQQAFRPVKIEQKTFTDTVLSRLYRWRISKFVKQGLIEYRSDMFNHRWIAPAMPVLDPQKEMQAELMAIDMGKETLTSLIQKSGGELLAVLTQRQKELDEMRARGIPVVHSQATLPYDFTQIDDNAEEDSSESSEESIADDGNTTDEDIDDGI